MQLKFHNLSLLVFGMLRIMSLSGLKKLTLRNLYKLLSNYLYNKLCLQTQSIHFYMIVRTKQNSIFSKTKVCSNLVDY